MPEYRHIANLLGPANDPGQSLANPILLTTSDNLDELAPGFYRVGNNNVADHLATPEGRMGDVHVSHINTTTPRIVQKFSTTSDTSGAPFRAWHRGTDGSGNYSSGWINTYPGDSPSEKIKELARRDGWLAVYDPTDPDNVMVEDGRAVRIHDGLGALPSLQSNATFGPTVEKCEFGQLSGLLAPQGDSRWMRAVLNSGISSPVTIVIVARNSEQTSTGTRYLFDQWQDGDRHRILKNVPSTGGAWAAEGGSSGLVSGEDPSDTDPQIIRVAFDGRRTGITVDGQWSGYGGDGSGGTSQIDP